MVKDEDLSGREPVRTSISKGFTWNEIDVDIEREDNKLSSHQQVMETEE